MGRAKAIVILGIIILSLLPVYGLYKYLQVRIQPRQSLHRFLLWLLAMFAIIFAYTFLVVFVIRLLFPEA